MYRFLKRAFDLLFSFLAIVILVPFFIILIIAVAIDQKGHVFFVQKRLGKNMRLFHLIKFRTMDIHAPNNVTPNEIGNHYDQYVTRFGRFLRLSALDEIPQLFNIFAGRMSFIGYRPSQIVEEELNNDRLHYGIYKMKPGLSGWAQVKTRHNPKLKVSFEKEYAEKASLCFDIKIFFLTIGLLLSRIFHPKKHKATD
ncbi:MAG: sugar transferase [Bacilli bacterium]|jgi:O-antigen biosynthesis protein WbqP